eukprot:GHVP01014215.1.p1 GENE.GHVP01014215.1~~GHVP01014215.1.p1  ORF type:complete len:285 (-),score=57.80 GHVP01014215.1:1456-2310(-)
MVEKMNFPLSVFECFETVVNPKDVVDICRNAAKEILLVYSNGDFGVSAKIGTAQKNEPLTQADLAANDVITKGLTHLYPLIPIISEENPIPDFEIRKEYKCFWQVDPLDGTKEFIKRNGEFTVNIALIKNGVPIFGIVSVPVTGEEYIAAEKQGAYKNLDLENWKKIQCAEFKLADKNLRIFVSRSHQSQASKNFIQNIDNPIILEAGSSIKFMRIAEGTAHLYPRFAPTSEWDISASDAIVREAGGFVIQVQENGEYLPFKPMEYNKENLLNPHFIVFGNLKA